MRQFYLARLLTPAGNHLASEEVWTPPLDALPPGYDPAKDFSPEQVTEDVLAFFSSDEHAEEVAGNVLHMFGPFAVDEAAPSYVFAVPADYGDDFDASAVAYDAKNAALKPGGDPLHEAEAQDDEPDFLTDLAPAAQNERRAGWALAALDTFSEETFGGRSFDSLAKGDDVDAFADLLCNLRHLAKARGFDFDDLDGRGRRNFEHESAPDYAGD